ncbi:glycosyltransferase family 4 protein [Ramlibacter sp. AN1015]|uniref:glycosyltransferase family 4 protein n=1 Tax=Ramlibacter sp. AN1015 TaxID=3133428 RepID=UPI0030C5C99B
MKVLITNATCIQDIPGGASRCVDEIARFLARSGHLVTIYVPNRLQKRQRESAGDGVAIIRFPYFRGFLRILNPAAAFYHYWRNFRGEQFDLIWGNSPEPWLYIPKRAAKRIYTMHGPWLLEASLDGSDSRIKRFLIPHLYKRILSLGPLLHFQSNYVRKACRAEFGGIDALQSVVAPALVDEACLAPGRDLLVESLDREKLTILVARRLVNRTGVVRFLNDVRSFEAISGALQVIVVGDGYLAAEVREIARHCSFLRYLGPVEQEVLDSLYAKCDVCAMPSLDAEGFGVSVLEAVFRGRPVIYSKGGGMGEFLDQFIPEYGYDISNRAALKKILTMCLQRKRAGLLKVEPSEVPYSFSKSLSAILAALQ